MFQDFVAVEFLILQKLLDERTLIRQLSYKNTQYNTQINSRAEEVQLFSNDANGTIQKIHRVLVMLHLCCNQLHVQVNILTNGARPELSVQSIPLLMNKRIAITEYIWLVQQAFKAYCVTSQSSKLREEKTALIA